MSLGKINSIAVYIEIAAPDLAGSESSLFGGPSPQDY